MRLYSFARLESFELGAGRTDVTALNSAISSYRSNRNNLLAPEDGKVYVIRHFADLRYLSNSTSNGETLSAVARPNNSVLWIAQKVGEKYQMVSYKADGCMAKKADASRGAMTTNPTVFEVAPGTLFGAQYLNVDNWSLSGNRNLSYVEMVAHKTLGNDNNQWGIIFGDDVVTGVTEVPAASTLQQNDAPLYDLSGRRVQRPVRGHIYLQNGRKVIF